MILFLEPADVWLFRDGRPFNAFDDHRAKCIFPPYPTVIQGAVRSHHLALMKVDCRDQRAIARLVGTSADVRQLRIRGPFLARRHGAKATRLAPVPFDALIKDTDSISVRPLSVPEEPPPTAMSSCPTPNLLGLRDQPDAKWLTGLWLTEEDLARYLKGDQVVAIHSSDLFRKEVRTGIARADSTRASCEGALYEVEYVRTYPNTGLLAEITGYEGWPCSGVMKLGGEGRCALFEQVDAQPWPEPPDLLPRRFKLCFVTPTYFAGGWTPAGRNWSGFFEGRVEMVSAAIGRYEPLGGFDLATRMHKPSRRYVPAGSVYYFRTDGEARVRPNLVQGAITDWGAEIGFGQVVIEEW